MRKIESENGDGTAQARLALPHTHTAKPVPADPRTPARARLPRVHLRGRQRLGLLLVLDLDPRALCASEGTTLINGLAQRTREEKERERRVDALLRGFLGAGALPLPFLAPCSSSADFRLPVVGPGAASSSSEAASSSSSDASSSPSSSEKPSKSDCVRGKGGGGVSRGR